MGTIKQFQCFILAAGLSLALAGNAFTKEKVVIVDPGWDSAKVTQLVLAEVIENRLNVEVEKVRLDLNLTYAGMDKGDGTVDILSEFWMPAQQSAYDKYVIKGSRETVVRGKKFYGEQGWYVPGFIQDKYGVKKVSDLLKPEIVKVLDFDGNGKGDFWPGAPGWGSTPQYLVQAKSYGFSELYEPMEVSDAILKAQVKKAFRLKKGFLFTYWKPEGLHAQYDLRLLEESKFDGYSNESAKDHPDYNPDGCFNYVSPKDDPDWYEKSDITCSFPVLDTSIAYSKSLETRLPKVAQFLSQLSVDASTVSQWSYEVAAEKKDPLDVAKDWIAANPDIINAWLKGIDTVKK